MLTNKLNLPLPLYEAIAADPYSNDGADISVTGLLKPTQQWVLEKRHRKDLQVEASSRLWATYGQLMSLLLERTVKSSEALRTRFWTECRVHTMVNNWHVSGAFDLYDWDTKTLSDYKFVGSYAAKKALAGEKQEYVQQLNILRWLCVNSSAIPFQPEHLQIVLLLRDHTAKSEAEGLKPVEVIDIPVQPLEEVGAWVEGRVKEFQDALKLEDWQLPDCTSLERWGGRRCEKYCDVGKAGKCIQLNALQDAKLGGFDGDKYPQRKLEKR